MNCPFCQTALKPEAFATWHIGGRKMYSYYCYNRNCGFINGDIRDLLPMDKIQVELVLPDLEVVSYTFVFELNGKWYRMFSHSGAPTKQITKPITRFMYYEVRPTNTSLGFNEKDVILTMERFIPLDWNKSIEEQVEAAREKLKTLLPFL